jgi:universal stress protein A
LSLSSNKEEALMFSPKKVLVPTDFSEFSDDALSEAVDIAQQYKATIYLFHVLSIRRTCGVDYCMSSDVMEDVRREGLRYAEEMMQKQLEKIGRTKGVEIVTDVREGAPIYEEILDEQKAKGADLIVIASHGMTGLLHHLMGSVADKVIRSATCPVYLVRRPR